MMVTYKIQMNQDGRVYSIVRSDGWHIPINEDNTDYQEYLKWLTEGNEPLPPDNIEGT